MPNSACTKHTFSKVVVVLKKSSINSFHCRGTALRFRDKAHVSTLAEESSRASAPIFALRSRTILWHNIVVFSMHLTMWSSRFVNKSKCSLLVASKFSNSRVSLDNSVLCCSKCLSSLMLHTRRFVVASDIPSAKRFARKSTFFDYKCVQSNECASYGIRNFVVVSRQNVVANSC